MLDLTCSIAIKFLGCNDSSSAWIEPGTLHLVFSTLLLDPWTWQIFIKMLSRTNEPYKLIRLRLIGNNFSVHNEILVYKSVELITII